MRALRLSQLLSRGNWTPDRRVSVRTIGRMVGLRHRTIRTCASSVLCGALMSGCATHRAQRGMSSPQPATVSDGPTTRRETTLDQARQRFYEAVAGNAAAL